MKKRRSTYAARRSNPTVNSPLHPDHVTDWSHRLARAWLAGELPRVRRAGEAHARELAWAIAERVRLGAPRRRRGGA